MAELQIMLLVLIIIKYLKKKIKNIFKQNTELAKLLESSRFFTDAVPLLEKSFAQKAGLGFQGKNTLLISKQQGSYNFILEFISDLELEADTDLTEHMATCGACHRCNTVCPTDALKSEYEIDARECISYLTIENRDEVPLELRNKIGDWIFGCDLCQSICPYNRKNLNNIENIKAMETKIHEFHPTQGLGHWLNLNSVLCLDQNTTKYIDDYYDPKITNILKKIFGHDVNEYLDQIFYNHFGSTSLSRTKREGLIRNAIIVATNNKSEESLPLIKRLCNSSNKVISDLAKWSLAK